MTRTTLALGLIALTLALPMPADRAAAGTVSGLISPSNCASPFVADAMADPNSFVPSGEKVCKALCKRAASQCKQYAKGSLSCSLGAAKLERRYGLENCKLISASPADLKSCVAGVNAGYASFKAGNAQLAPQIMGDCAQWGDDCQTACAGTPL